MGTGMIIISLGSFKPGEWFDKYGLGVPGGDHDFRGGILVRWTEPRRTRWPYIRRFSALAWSLVLVPWINLPFALLGKS